MRSTNIRKPPAIAALLLSALALAACGESAQEKAKAQVCSARADISKQITKITELKVSSNLPSEVKSGVEAIGSDLTKMKNAQGNLDSARKEQVKTATHAFEAQFNSILTGVTSINSLSSAESQLKSALAQLATSYKQALAPINCS